MSNFTSPAIQAMNLVRYIGDEVLESGSPIFRIDCADICTTIGAPTGVFAAQLLKDLASRGTVKFEQEDPYYDNRFIDVTLTLDGWNQYETEKRGEFRGNYGFIAMQFGESDLDLFVNYSEACGKRGPWLRPR